MPNRRRTTGSDEEPLCLEVIAPTLQGMGFCSACELVLADSGVGERPAERGLDEYPQEWQEDRQRLNDWVYDFADRYGANILIKVIDPQSPEGLWKSLRYRIRHYPTWVVNGQVRIVGWDRHALETAVQERI